MVPEPPGQMAQTRPAADHTGRVADPVHGLEHAIALVGQIGPGNRLRGRRRRQVGPHGRRFPFGSTGRRRSRRRNGLGPSGGREGKGRRRPAAAATAGGPVTGSRAGQLQDGSKVKFCAAIAGRSTGGVTAASVSPRK